MQGLPPLSLPVHEDPPVSIIQCGFCPPGHTSCSGSILLGTLHRLWDALGRLIALKSDHLRPLRRRGRSDQALDMEQYHQLQHCALVTYLTAKSEMLGEASRTVPVLTRLVVRTESAGAWKGAGACGWKLELGDSGSSRRRWED